MNIRLNILTLLTVCIALWVMPETAHGQFQSGDLFVSVNLRVNGSNNGPIYQYTPAGPPPTVFAPNLSFPFPRGLAFDSAGNLFVATENFDGVTFQGTILKIASDGTLISSTSAFPSNFFLQALAINNAGNVFVSGGYVNPPTYTDTDAAIYEVSPDFSTPPTIFFPTVPPDPLYPLHSNNTVGLAFDSAGNLFVAANVEQTVYKFLSTGGVLSSTPTIFVSGAPPFQSGEGPSALTFDASGNLFVSSIFTDASGEILEFTPAGAPYPATPTGTPGVFATLINFPKGLAFDRAGNLFVAETGASTSGDILKFTAPGFSVSTFDDGTSPPDHFGTPGTGNHGPEWLAFVPGSSTTTSAGSNVTTPAGTVGFATISLTFPSVSPPGGTTTVTPVSPSSAGYTLPGSSLAFDITTTAAYTTPITIAFQVARPLDVSQLKVYHYVGGIPTDVTASRDETTNTIYASVTSLSPFVVAHVPFTAQVQEPINSDGSSVFSVKRGVVPVTFTLTSDGTPTCQLPPATILVFRTAGGVVGSVDESMYLMKADSGSNFRVDTTKCQYVYNLAASSLGPGTYKVNISIAGIVVGSGTFALK
jgi:hypothetical protein